MAKDIPFLLKMGNGKKVRTIEKLREHFDLETVRRYYADGRLIRWLKSRYYEEEAEKIEDLDPHLDSFEESLCEILGVCYKPSYSPYTAVEVKKERLEKLRQYTADDKILASVDDVAFTQVELEVLLEKRREVIYLCGKQFDISGDVEDRTYIGINTPTIRLKNGKVRKGIDISGIEFDICNYIDAAISNIYATIRNDLINVDDCPTEGEFRGMSNTMDNTNKFSYYFMDNPQLCVKLLNMVTKKESAVALAKFVLSWCYTEGFGTEENIKESIKCLQCAAELGLVEAQESLGCRYLYGKDVQKNAEEAIKWFQKAAEQGETDAQFYLGYCYKYGLGIDRNVTEAIKWLFKSLKQGNEMAKAELIEIAPQSFMLSEVILYAVGGKENLYTKKEAKLDKGMGTIDIPVCETDLVKEDVLKEFGAISVSVKNEYIHKKEAKKKKIFPPFAKPKIKTKSIKQPNGWLHIKFTEISTKMEEDFDKNIKFLW